MASSFLRAIRTTASASSFSSSAPRRSLASGAASAAVVKRTTGVVGLDVEPGARELLIALYSKTLRDVRTLLPENAAYRKTVEQMTGFRLDVVRATPEVSDESGPAKSPGSAPCVPRRRSLPAPGRPGARLATDAAVAVLRAAASRRLARFVIP